MSGDIQPQKRAALSISGDLVLLAHRPPIAPGVDMRSSPLLLTLMLQHAAAQGVSFDHEETTPMRQVRQAPASHFSECPRNLRV